MVIGGERAAVHRQESRPISADQSIVQRSSGFVRVRWLNERASDGAATVSRGDKRDSVMKEKIHYIDEGKREEGIVTKSARTRRRSPSNLIWLVSVYLPATTHR